MRIPRFFFFFCLITVTLFGTAATATAKEDILQHLLAPGEFSTFHKYLSGINNCSKCHTIGKGVSARKCLDCHKKIGKRLAQKKGFHGKMAGECIDCHKEHGKEPIVFNQEKFDHRQAVFHLDGNHLKVPCEKCHQQTEKQTGKKRFTYMGLAVTCSGCHKNPHEQHFAECGSCHSSEKWQLPHFDHNDKERYKLVGMHQQVACEKCHVDFGKKERKKLRFSIDTTRQCLSCHKDQHQGQLSPDCLSCHSMKGWKSVEFDHDKGKFPLVGPHKKLSCKACHQDPKIKNVPTDCGSCHKKTPHNAVHTPCRTCHTQENWQPLQRDRQKQRDMHKSFRYPLQGAHAKVECEKCHELQPGKPVYFKMAFADCVDCHKDKHQGRLAPPCSRCHRVDSFKNLAFFDHEQADFKLGELHKTVACEKCHPKKEYQQAPIRCFSCHLDIARFSRGFYKRTTMGLISPKAKIVRCTGCHQTNVVDFKVTKETCGRCHEDVYREFFSQWRQQFYSRLDAVERDLGELKLCREENRDMPDLDPTEEAIRFLRKDFEHNYRFSAALLDKLGREVVDIRHEYCKN